MKRSQAFALTAVTTTLALGLTFYLLHKRKHAKRKKFVSNAGYEMAYDIHYPPKYQRPRSRDSHRDGRHSEANGTRE